MKDFCHAVTPTSRLALLRRQREVTSHEACNLQGVLAPPVGRFSEAEVIDYCGRSSCVYLLLAVFTVCAASIDFDASRRARDTIMSGGAPTVGSVNTVGGSSSGNAAAVAPLADVEEEDTESEEHHSGMSDAGDLSD